MKLKLRMIAGLLAVLGIGSLCACNREGENVESAGEVESAPSIITDYFDGESTRPIEKDEVLNWVEEGKFTALDTNGEPVEVTLGTTETPIRTAFENPETGAELFGSEGDKYIRFYTGYTQMYIPKSDPSQGVIAVVHTDMAYGFEISTTNSESIKAVLGEPVEEDWATESQAAVLIDPSIRAWRMVYESGENRLEFFLVDNLLVATCLSNRALWNR